MNFYCSTPMRAKPIGRYHPTPLKALAAALRNAKRLGVHVHVKHWQGATQYTVFPDGEVIDRRAIPGYAPKAGADHMAKLSARATTRCRAAS
jgi:hypothetical protein